MHPVIHLALKKYVETKYGPRGWLDSLDLAGVSTALPYVRVVEYPDKELLAIVDAVARSTGAEVSAVLEDFGAAMVPDLIAMYPRLVRREWRSLDLIYHTEQTIHQLVRQRYSGSRPPLIRCQRVSATELRLTYESARRLCALARGIVRGVGEHYAEVLRVNETRCMLRGDAACEFLIVQETPAPASPPTQ